jgi:hypothetical protein
MVSSFSFSDSSHIHFVIIEGKMGTGRGEAAVWTRYKAETMDLQCTSVALQKADAMYDYRGAQKIFRALIKEENYDDLERQSFVVNELLMDMHPLPSEKETREKVVFPAMQIALGVKCELSSSSGVKRRKAGNQGNTKVAVGSELDDDPLLSQAANTGKGGTKHKPGEGGGDQISDKANAKQSLAEQFFNSTKLIVPKKLPKLPASVVSQCVVDILTKLLSVRPIILIIEDS